MKKSRTKAIVFDLGGVIIDLEVNATYQAFAELGSISIEDLLLKVEYESFFNAYEKGMISDVAFRKELRRITKHDASDREIDLAWNAMLGPVKPSKIKGMAKLATQYKTYILSNTNDIHIRAAEKTLQASASIAKFDNLVDFAFYSQKIHMRKPDLEIYQHVTKEIDINPEEILFIDDNAENIKTAKEYGWQVFHNVNNEDWLSLTN